MVTANNESTYSDLYPVLDYYNKLFKEKYGYCFCRCYSCVFPIIIEKYKEIAESSRLETELGNVVQAINDDYIESADARMGIRTHSGLVCGNDCIFYEECVEAYPFPFWEIDCSQIIHLVEILSKAFKTPGKNDCYGYCPQQRERIGTDNNV